MLRRGVRDCPSGEYHSGARSRARPLEGWLTSHTNNTFIVGTSKMQHKFGYTAVALSLSCAACFSLVGSAALANGRDYNDGPVVNVSTIRTADGHFDDYMHWLATAWKKQEEAGKKAGLILDYHVYTAEPRSPNDPDIYLVVTYKNWAALDGIGAKFDAVSGQMEGSLEKADQAEAARGKIRTVLGSETIQEAALK
jgi:hypothetical protein